MLFNSVEYIFFLPIIVLVYFISPQRYRWIVLLTASYYFYAVWDPRYIFLIITSTLVDYLVCQAMKNKREPGQRKPYLMISLLVNLGILGFFKYYNFVLDNIFEMTDWITLRPELSRHSLDLPIGLSFYTFQTLSYTIDVYRGNIRAENHLGKFALFVSYFPQLIAGPIERANRLLPQFNIKHKPKYVYFREGFVLILWGLFKKVVVGDRLGYYVYVLFENPETYPGFTSLLGAVFFTIQIYCDFSAYSDIARGSSMFFGIKLIENFRRPFFAINTRELIGRWHISLTNWFRDYLFIPLGGSQTATPRLFLNLFIVWSLTGLWHGAQWTFVLTAQLNCLFLIVGHITLKSRKQLLRGIGVSPDLKFMRFLDVSFTFFIGALAMVFFRAHSIGDGWTILTNITRLSAQTIVPQNLYLTGMEMSIAVAGITTIFSVEYKLEREDYMTMFYRNTPRFMRYSIVLLLMTSLVLLNFKIQTPFIYFQF